MHGRMDDMRNLSDHDAMSDPVLTCGLLWSVVLLSQFVIVYRQACL